MCSAVGRDANEPERYENMETLVLWRYKPECSAVGRGANEEDVEDGILILRC